ncbi:MAG TPA: 50S ribosomal protein L30 [Solirubrobacterales bacterium]|nr:50S ribosomal protein L30 [Solirubrobacterales bacterium]
MAELTLRQVHSSAGASAKQRGALESLKLGRIGRTSTMEDTPQLRGALAKVAHLVEVNGVTPQRGVSRNPQEL